MTKRTCLTLLLVASGGVWLAWPDRADESPEPASTRSRDERWSPRAAGYRDAASFEPAANIFRASRSSQDDAQSAAPAASRSPGIHPRRDSAFLRNSKVNHRTALPDPTRQQLRRLRLGARGPGSGEEGPGLQDALDGSRNAAGLAPPPDTCQRVAGIREAAADGLDEAEIQAAYEFVENAPDDIAGGNHHWMADEVLIALRNQEPLPDGIGTRLAAIAADPHRDPVIRDYALQHLGHLHQQGGADPAVIEAALWQAACSTQGNLAGTALIALSAAARDGRLSNPAELPGLSRTMATDPAYSPATRSTALSLLGEHGGEAALPILEAIGRDRSAPSLLRLGALSALADTGAGRPILESHLDNPEERLRNAARSLLAVPSR